MKQTRTIPALGVKVLTDNFGKSTFKPINNVGSNAPQILKEYLEDGVRMYECAPAEGKTEPRHFVAEAYEKNFFPAHNKVMNRDRKTGANSNYKLNAGNK